MAQAVGSHWNEVEQPPANCLIHGKHGERLAEKQKRVMSPHRQQQ